MDPADAEADAGRSQPVGEGEHERLAAALTTTIPFSSRPVLEALDDRLVRRRLGERGVEAALEVAARLEPEDAALATRVGGLEHRREARPSRARRGPRGGRGRRRSAAAGTPASASVRRIATLCVIRCAVWVPIPGRPSASATAATTGTARSAETVRTPSTAWRRPASIAAATSAKSTTSATSASCRPGALCVAVDRRRRAGPARGAWAIARRWWRPAPTKRTVFTAPDAIRAHPQNEGIPSRPSAPRPMTGA